MKHKNKLWFFIAIIILTGFVVISCDNDKNDCTHTPGEAATCTTAQPCTKCGNVVKVALGHSEGTCIRCGVLWLSNIPVTFYDETTETNFTFTLDDGVKPLSNFINGTPKVQITGTGDNRRLSIELDIPKSTAPFTSFHEWQGVIVTPDDTRIFEVSNNFWNSSETLNLAIENHDYYMHLVYFDKDVTLNGNGRLTSFNNITFKKGWNYWINKDDSDNVIVTSSQTLPANSNWFVAGLPPPPPK